MMPLSAVNTQIIVTYGDMQRLVATTAVHVCKSKSLGVVLVPNYQTQHNSYTISYTTASRTFLIDVYYIFTYL